MKSKWKIKVLDPFFLMKVMDRDTKYLERNVLKSVSVIALLTMVFSYEKIFCSGKLMQVLKHRLKLMHMLAVQNVHILLSCCNHTRQCLQSVLQRVAVHRAIRKIACNCSMAAFCAIFNWLCLFRST